MFLLSFREGALFCIQIKEVVSVKRQITMLFSALLVVMLCSGIVSATPKKVVFSDLSWDSIQFHNRVMAFLMEKGWDYETDFLFSEEMPGYVALERGDVHVVLEVWTEGQLEWWQGATKAGKVIDLGTVFPNARSGWYVPYYVAEGDPEKGIPSVRSIEDIREHWMIFKNPENPEIGRFINAPTGWAAHTINKDKIKGYGLEDKLEPFDTGSATALRTVIVTAYQRHEPIVAYYWEPTPLLGELDMVMIEEPPYDPEIWETTHACASPAFTVAKAVNPAWIQANEEVRGLLERYHMTLEKTNEALAWMKNNGYDVDKTAIWFLKENTDLWHQWVEDEEKIKRIEKALKTVS